jgi:hypothetical protein
MGSSEGGIEVGGLSWEEGIGKILRNQPDRMSVSSNCIFKELEIEKVWEPGGAK